VAPQFSASASWKACVLVAFGRIWRSLMGFGVFLMDFGVFLMHFGVYFVYFGVLIRFGVLLMHFDTFYTLWCIIWAQVGPKGQTKKITGTTASARRLCAWGGGFSERQGGAGRRVISALPRFSAILGFGAFWKHFVLCSKHCKAFCSTFVLFLKHFSSFTKNTKFIY